MHKTTKTVGAGVATLATIALTAGAASAASTSDIIKIGKYGELSASHKIAWVKVKVICTEDTVSAEASASLSQVTHGSLQSNTGTVSADNAFECSGDEEVVYIPVRRPTNGFKWVKGAARVNYVTFETWGPDGANEFNELGGRTIHLR